MNETKAKCDQCDCVQLVCCGTATDICIECCDCHVGQRVRLLARKLAGTEEAALKMLDASGKRAKQWWQVMRGIAAVSLTVSAVVGFVGDNLPAVVICMVMAFALAMAGNHGG